MGLRPERDTLDLKKKKKKLCQVLLLFIRGRTNSAADTPESIHQSSRTVENEAARTAPQYGTRHREQRFAGCCLQLYWHNDLDQDG
jgi:hypothetical protein